MNDAIKMQVSAFVDGELPENETELLVRRLSQDHELRQQVADYLAIGRVLRRERGVDGVEGLRERIAAVLDERPSQDDAERAAAGDTSRLLRPLTGVAIAATVAMIAIFGLQQTPLPGEAGVDEVATAEVTPDDIYTEPAPADDMLSQYWRIHGEAASEFGANGINSRLVTLQYREEILVEEVPDEEDDNATDTAEDPAPASSNP